MGGLLEHLGDPGAFQGSCWSFWEVLEHLGWGCWGTGGLLKHLVVTTVLLAGLRLSQHRGRQQNRIPVAAVPWADGSGRGTRVHAGPSRVHVHVPRMCRATRGETPGCVATTSGGHADTARAPAGTPRRPRAPGALREGTDCAAGGIRRTDSRGRTPPPSPSSPNHAQRLLRVCNFTTVPKRGTEVN